MSRPTTFLKDTTLVWVMRLYDPEDGVTLIDADSTPTVAVRKNGSAVGDSVTVTKRSATTGIYDCSYNPAAEAEGDQFTLEESATIAAVAYQSNWECSVAPNVDTLISSVLTKMKKYFALISRNDATVVSDWATELSEINSSALGIFTGDYSPVDQSLEATALSSANCNKIADHVLRRNQANVEASANGDTLDVESLYGDIQARQNASLSGSTLTVKKTDDTTLGTLTITTDPNALPVSAIAQP